MNEIVPQYTSNNGDHPTTSLLRLEGLRVVRESVMRNHNMYILSDVIDIIKNLGFHEFPLCGGQTFLSMHGGNDGYFREASFLNIRADFGRAKYKNTDGNVSFIIMGEIESNRRAVDDITGKFPEVRKIDVTQYL